MRAMICHGYAARLSISLLGGIYDVRNDRRELAQSAQLLSRISLLVSQVFIVTEVVVQRQAERVHVVGLGI